MSSDELLTKVTPTISNTELVNLMVEQFASVIEKEIAERKEQLIDLLEQEKVLFEQWWRLEKVRLTGILHPKCMVVYDIMRELFPMDSHPPFTLFFPDMEVEWGRYSRHRLHVSRETTVQWIAMDELDNLRRTTSEFAQHATMEVTVDIQDHDGILERMKVLSERHDELSEEISDRLSRLENRDRLEKQALARLTAQTISASPELSKSVAEMTGLLTSGQLFLTTNDDAPS